MNFPTHLRRSHVLLALLLGFLAGLFPQVSHAAHSKDFPANNWQNGLASVSADATLYKAGDTVTVSVTCNSDYWCQNLILGVPGAISAELDGVPVAQAVGASYVDHLFDANPHPSPSGCFFINYPGGKGSHTAKFKLDDSASGKFTKFVNGNGVTQIAGPFVILDRPQYQMWSTLFPIEIDGNPKPFSLTKTAQTQHTEGAKPEELITYTLTAKAPPTAKQIVIEDTLPKGVTLEGSIGSDGVVNKQNLKWTVNSGGTVTKTYSVRVAKYRDLPKGIKSLATRATGQTTLESKKKLPANASNTVNLILPWTITGLTKDIIFDFPKSKIVNVKRVTPFLDVELVDASNKVVDTDNGKASGMFELHAREPGRHRIRAKAKVDRLDLGTDTVVKEGATLTGGAVVEVLATDPPEKKYKKDCFVPVSLSNHLTAQLLYLRTFQSAEGNFFGFDYNTQTMRSFLSDVLGLQIELPGAYDVSDALALLTKAQTDGSFIDNMGNPVFFEKLYDGTGEQDGWSAVVRLSSFIDMLSLRQKEFAKMADKCGLAIAKGLALAAIIDKGQRKAAQAQAAADPNAPKEPPPLGKMRIEAAKIGTLGFGVGIALPPLVDKYLENSALSPAEKAKKKAQIIEIIAKVTRYGWDIICYKIMSGKLQEDLNFEALFQPLRFLTTVGLMDIYREMTEENLKSLASDLAVGIYTEDTTAILEAFSKEDDRIHDRSGISSGLINDTLGATSFVRALDGVLGKLKLPLEAVGDGAKKKALAGILLYTGNVLATAKVPSLQLVDSAKLSTVGTPLKTTVIVGAIGAVLDITLWELVLRDRDMLNFETLANHGKFSDGSSALPKAAKAPTAARICFQAPSISADTIASAPETRTAADPNSPKEKYLAALKATDADLKSKTHGDFNALRQQLIAAHTAFFGPLITLHDRLTLAGPGLPEAQNADAARFVVAIETLLAYTAHAYETLRLLPEDPGAALTAVAHSNLNKVASLIKMYSGTIDLAPAPSAITGLPGQFTLREGDAPADAAVLSGNPFDLEIEVKNVGDAATTSRTITLDPGTDLVLVSPAAGTVPALQSGDSVTMVWSVKARAVDPAGQALTYHATLSDAAGANSELAGFIVVEPD